MALFIILLIWMVLILLSLFYVTYDLVKRPPEGSLSKISWWLVTLYTGPVALVFYRRYREAPSPHPHDLSSQHVLGGMVLSLAGNVTGILIAAIILSFIPVGMGLEIFIQYFAGLGCALTLFRSHLKQQAAEPSPVRGPFYSEVIVLNWIMAGMIPTMVIWTALDSLANSSLSLHFWGKMSLATIVAWAVASHANQWLIKHQLKQGIPPLHPNEEEAPAEKYQSPPLTDQELWKTFFYSFIALAIGIAVGAIVWAVAG